MTTRFELIRFLVPIIFMYEKKHILSVGTEPEVELKLLLFRYVFSIYLLL